MFGSQTLLLSSAPPPHWDPNHSVSTYSSQCTNTLQILQILWLSKIVFINFKCSNIHLLIFLRSVPLFNLFIRNIYVTTYASSIHLNKQEESVRRNKLGNQWMAELWSSRMMLWIRRLATRSNVGQSNRTLRNRLTDFLYRSGSMHKTLSCCVTKPKKSQKIGMRISPLTVHNQ